MEFIGCYELYSSESGHVSYEFRAESTINVCVISKDFFTGQNKLNMEYECSECYEKDNYIEISIVDEDFVISIENSYNYTIHPYCRDCFTKTTGIYIEDMIQEVKNKVVIEGLSYNEI